MSEMVKVWGPLAVAFLAVVIGFCGQLLLIQHQRKQSERQNDLTQKQLAIAKSKEEREEIQRKLNLFYGPFKELRTQSKLLYRRFAVAHREEGKKLGQRF